MRAAEYRATVAESMSEKQFQQWVVDLARRLGWLVYHTFDSRRSAPGFPDLVLVRGDRLLFRELKAANGVVSAHQRVWLHGLKLARADVDVWRPKDMKKIEQELRRG